MFNKLKNNPFLLATIALTALFIVCISAHYSSNLPEQAQQVSINPEFTSTLCPEQFLEHVDMLMTNTWDQIETNAGITIDDCHAYLAHYGSSIEAQIRQENLQAAELGISEKTKALIHEILNAYSIDIHSIDIVAIDGGCSPAGANEYTIYIDEKVLATFCSKAQRFIIAHEIAHVKNKDASFETALVNLVNSENKNHSLCLDTFGYSIEFRADITAMFLGSEYTKGGIAFFNEYMKRYGNYKAPSHPAPMDRLKIAQDVDAMHAQQEQQAQHSQAVA